MQIWQTCRELLLALTIALVWHGDCMSVMAQEKSQDICAKDKSAAVQFPKSSQTVRVNFDCDEETNTLFKNCRLPEYSKTLRPFFFAIVDGPDGLPYKLTCREQWLPIIEGPFYATTVCSKDHPTALETDWISFACDRSKTEIKECIVDGLKPGVEVGVRGAVVVRKSGRRYTLTCFSDSAPFVADYNKFTSVAATCSRTRTSADFEVGDGVVEVTFKCSYDKKDKLNISFRSCKPKGKRLAVSAGDNGNFEGPNGQKLNILCLPDAEPKITLKA